jgi:tetratricopeptide (TPR) repeat protein
MNCIVRRLLPATLLTLSVFTLGAPARGQVNTTVSARPAITVLDSTKEQDGLVGSVRRVKTETAKIELKDGRPVEGPAQLVEVTTYGIKGDRIENTSYPIGGSLVGKEEYKYDERGNITEMTVRDERGAILSREAYSYEFDKFGNWTKMVTSLVVFENGELKREPIEVSYRTVTYYFDDNIAKIVEEPKTVTATAVPALGAPEVQAQEVLNPGLGASVSAVSLKLAGEPPPPRQPVKSVEPVTETKSPLASNVASESPAVREAPEVKTEDAQQKLAFTLYTAGRDRFDAGDAPGAIESYLQSIKLEPRSAEVHLSLGHAYLRLQKDRDAIKAFKESIKLNPKNAETHYGLGFANFRLGKFREAADEFKKATTLEPRLAKAHYGLSLAYQELGMESGLMEEYRILETLDRSLARKLAQTFPQYNFSCRLVRGCP